MQNINHIKAVLAEQNKMCKRLAGQLGKSACAVSKWCSSSIHPNWVAIDKIAKLLDVDKCDLLTLYK